MLNKNEVNKMRCELWGKVYAECRTSHGHEGATEAANRAVETFNEVFGEVFLENESKRDEQNGEWDKGKWGSIV